MKKFNDFVRQGILVAGLAPIASFASPPLASPSLSAVPISVSMPATASNQSLQDNPLFQQKLSLDATDCPLGDVLAQLSPTLPVKLTASTQVADQRITLHLRNQPLYLLMARLPALMSHSPQKPRGYYWEKLESTTAARPVYNLWRDLNSHLEEEYELDYPRREAGVMLHNLRDLCRMTVEERKNYHGDYPYIPLPETIKEQPFGQDSMPLVKALKNLNDEQLDNLMKGDPIALNPDLFAAELNQTKQNQLDQELHQQEIAKIVGSPDPYPHGLPEPQESIPFIYVTSDDENGQVISRSYLYAIHINGISQGLLLDPFDRTQNPDPNRVARSMYGPKSLNQKSPMVDLTPLLTDKNVTPSQRGDIGFTLQALAKTAGINLYQEDFLKPNPAFGQPSEGIKLLKAPLADIILAICDEWNYQVLKVGDDYFFWSRTWALDRSWDVPDRFVKKWQTKLKKQGTFTLNDRAEISAALTWPQMTQTLSMILPEGCSSSLQSYKMFRLMGRLSPLEYEAAFSPNGVALADLSIWEQEAFAYDFQKELSQIDSDSIRRSVITFQLEQDGPPKVDKPVERIIFQVKGEDKVLIGGRDAFEISQPIGKVPIKSSQDTSK